MRIQVKISTPGAQPALDPLSDFYVLLHDFETPVWNYAPRSLYDPNDGLKDTLGYPEMIPLSQRIGREWDDRMVRFMFDLCLFSQYGFTYKSLGWNALTNEQKRKAASEFQTAFDSKRFATNDTGLDKYYNPISEEVLGEPHRGGLAKQWEVMCGGNVVKAVSHTPVKRYMTDNDGVKRNIDCIQVEVWDGRNPAPDALTFNWWTHPHLVHLATNSTPFGYDGVWTKTGPWRVDPFHFFGGKGTPYTLLFSSPNFVAMNRIRRLKQSELATRPYNP